MKTQISKPIDKRLVLNRFKEAKKITSDKELAEILGLSKSTLSNWIARNSLDYELLFSNCEQINIEWLLTGKGQMMKGYAEIIPDVVGELIKKYNTCTQCEAKDLLIKEKDERIAELKEMISILKGKNDCESKRHSA